MNNGIQFLETLTQIAEIYKANRVIGLFVVPAILCVFVYVFYKKRDELSFHALQNTSATIVVVGLNFAVLWAFGDLINGYAQMAYDRLGIPRLPQDFWVGVPILVTALIGLVAKDFVDYWNHRLMHTTWGWPTHAAHHSDTHVNAFTTYRVHFLESFVMAFSYIIVLTWLQMPEVLPLVFMTSHIHNLYVHVNLPYRHGPLKLLVASPVFHRWHHADTKAAYGKNLANIMPAWDALFGTYYDPGEIDVEMGAKSTGIEDKNPLLIFIYPFQQWAFLIRKRLRKLRPNKQNVTAKESKA